MFIITLLIPALLRLLLTWHFMPKLKTVNNASGYRTETVYDKSRYMGFCTKIFIAQE